jgi:hypothetical protein
LQTGWYPLQYQIREALSRRPMTWQCSNTELTLTGICGLTRIALNTPRPLAENVLSRLTISLPRPRAKIVWYICLNYFISEFAILKGMRSYPIGVEFWMVLHISYQPRSDCMMAAVLRPRGGVVYR